MSELTNKINNHLEKLKRYIVEFNNNIPELMDAPNDLTGEPTIGCGGEFHTDKPRYSDPTYWLYPDGVEEKIEDDKLYKVWYSTRYPADPWDGTTWNYVKYIQYFPNEKNEFKKQLQDIINLI